jgi:hypothetical protein
MRRWRSQRRVTTTASLAAPRKDARNQSSTINHFALPCARTTRALGLCGVLTLCWLGHVVLQDGLHLQIQDMSKDDWTTKICFQPKCSSRIRSVKTRGGVKEYECFESETYGISFVASRPRVAHSILLGLQSTMTRRLTWHGRARLQSWT